MEAARNVVSSFLGRDGKQHTNVDETVNPAVTSETVKPHRHEETTEAVDREVHKDHYHTSVQPLEHRETLPEEHKHNLAPQVEREFRHGDKEQERARVGAELGQFKDTSTTHETTQSSAAAPSQTGEHVHHHVHENVQPVIHKETIQPEVVHTTIPIHEKHTAPSEHHGLSQLPVKTLDEAQNAGTDLTGGARSHEEYEGHPRPYSAELQQERRPVDINPQAHEGTHDPGKTGHFGDLKTGTSGTSGATGTSGHIHQSTDETSNSGYGREANLGSGVAAGSGARDPGLNRTTAESGRDLDGNHTKGTFGDSGATTTGTALGGRTEGNTTANAASNAIGGDTNKMSPVGQHGSTREASHEHSNLTGGGAEPMKNSADDDVQHASKLGQDPSLEKDRGSKLTGTGEDGSHSAVFGLTPDGHKFNDTKNTTGSSAHMPKAEEESNQRDTGVDGNGNTSRAPGSGKVADQMNDPRVAEKGHQGKAEYTDSDAKPGAGTF